ncbi:MAG: hypothetical protein SGJ09_11925 [Phycisphaerae bacterium]|nr:hypothetical protein [Phycisphaerae bacterium]
MRILWTLLALLIGIAAALWIMVPSDVSTSPVTVSDTGVARQSVPSAPISAPHASPEAPPVPATGVAPTAPRATDPVRQVDARTIMLDDRFEVSGHGSENDPYRVQWNLLGSARESIITGGITGGRADGTTADVPAWIRPLDGGWIEISGYVSTPVVTEETREVLFTMNRWDGCCIGIPPTPFDSIEVKLERPITFVGKHSIRFGVMRGQLHVEPFALGGALLGIYRLEHAIVTTQAQ